MDNFAVSFFRGLFGAVVGAILGGLIHFIAIKNNTYITQLALFIPLLSLMGYLLLKGVKRKVIAGIIISLVSVFVIVLADIYKFTTIMEKNHLPANIENYKILLKAVSNFRDAEVYNAIICIGAAFTPFFIVGKIFDIDK